MDLMPGRFVALALILTVVAVAALGGSLFLAGPWRAATGPPGPAAPDALAAASPPPVAEAPAADRPPPLRVEPVRLGRGDTLTEALRRRGVSPQTTHEVAAALRRAGANLRRGRPGDTVEVAWSPEGEPRAVTWAVSPWLRIRAEVADGAWRASREEVPAEVQTATVQGTVTRSLFLAVEEAGESAALVPGIVNIFESDFDFTADTRPGDRFRVLVEKRFGQGRFVEYGRILAAQYLNEGRLLTGIGVEGREGRVAFYDLQGRSLRKMFLRSPLEFTRITSGFTYARPHPILGGVRPHLAIDYAAPVGTPVRAVADGVVLGAGWNGGNGIQVRLRHRRGYETFYNHLSRLGPGVARGARVGQRQVIGYVGSTGLSTGPHLDYRVMKDGRFVNPMSEKFIPGEPISPAERPAFQARARDLVARLEQTAPF